MLYFLCINWAGCPPWCAFKDSKESANPTWIVPSQLSTQCVTRYHRNIHKNIFRPNTSWSMTLKAFLSASGEFWMMRVTDVAGRVSWRCLGCCYLSPFFSSRLFPRGHLYAVWSHLPPTLIDQKEKQGGIWRSKEKYFDIWKNRRRKGWKCCEIHIYWASNYDWVWKGFLRQDELGKLRKYTIIQIGPTLWQKKQWQGTQILSLFGHQSELMLFWRGWVRKCLKLLITHFFHMGFV